MDVRAFGAVGDGHTDDTDAIQRALAKLLPGGGLRFPDGLVFCHSKVLVVSTPRARILGAGRLLATQEATSAVHIDAADVLVDGLSLGVANTTHRWSAPDQHKLYLGPHARIVVRNVSIDGSAAAGLFCDGSSDFSLHSVRVSSTRADGIHMTNGAHDGRVESPTTASTGDDGIAIVSYLSDAQSCRNIEVVGARIQGTAGGRGMSVVGGSGVTYRDIDIADSNAAALYISCEGGDFVTRDTDSVTVVGGRIIGANTNTNIDHGAVLVYSGRPGGSVTNVRISELTISGTRASASRQIGVVADGSADRVSGIRFDRLRLAAQPTPYEGNAPLSAMTLTDVTASGTTVRPTVAK